MGCDSSTLGVQSSQPRIYPSSHYNLNEPIPQNQPQNSHQYQYQAQSYTPQQQPYPSQSQPYYSPQQPQSYYNQQYLQPIPIYQANTQPRPIYAPNNAPVNNQISPKSRQNKKKSIKFSNKRGVMALNLNKNESFLSHHLKSQMYISKYARADLIRRRQVLQHNNYEHLLLRNYGQSTQVINQYAKKAFFQRIMLEIFETAHKQFFDQGKSYDEVRQKIAERYLFELYQTKQFMDAGLGKYSSFMARSQISMTQCAFISDSSLFPILRFLKQKYPQVADKSSIQFPQVKQKKQDINLLDNFPSKCYSTPDLVNIQTLFSDLKYLIDRSVQEFADFQADMKEILGEQVLTDSKVKKVTKDSNQQYSASPVRRVFIKWAETIIERIPSIIVSEAFLNFLKSKSIIADNFYFRSTVQPTTHGKVINSLCNLLQAAKYEITSLAKRKQFGFYIYDLLRCKVKRSTGQEICQLLKKMQETKVTASGKKFQVVRIKNRFKTPNRDLMVNFRYGDVIVGQAQLCIDTSDVSQITKKTNKFNHYIYELERGIFGPTCELIMQYEDFQRKDISANLQAEGKVERRIAKKEIDYLRKSTRKCFNGHQMIELKGNHFIVNEQGKYQDTAIVCDYCQYVFDSSHNYSYCYFCTLTFCHNCDKDYKKENLKELQMRCNRDELLPLLNTEEDIKKILPQCPIIIFHLSDAPSSVIYKDLIILLTSAFKLQKKPFPPIYRVCCDGIDKSWTQNKYSLKQYPTSILFSRDGTPQTTLIGASWSLLQGLFESQKLISLNQPKSLQVKCWCQSPLRQVNNQNDEEIFCLNCGNANQSEGLFDLLMGQDNSKVYVCQNGTHCRCLNCGFLINNQPSRYKDYRGRSYLYQTKTQPKVPKCSMGHQGVYVKNFIETQEFQCFKCQKSSILNKVYGAGYCQQCNRYCCSRCIGFDDDGLKKITGQIITHTAEVTAEEGQRCLCNRLFKKVYNTRDYVNNLLAGMVQGEDRSRQVLQSVYEQKKRQWNCIICQKKKKDGQLHLACFNCPYIFAKSGTNINIQICIECAIGTDLVNKQLKQNITELPSDFECKFNHPVVRTKLAHNNQQMTFDCIGCRKIFYIYSERYYCKICKTNFCYNCSSKQLINKNPPKCLRQCNQDHTLKLKQPSQSLTICNGCKITIRKNHFACPLKCGYDLCLQCAATPPGVDTTNNRMKHINHEELKRKMQEMQIGLVDEIVDAIDEVEQQQSQINNDLQQVAQGLQNRINQINQLNEWWNS